MTDRARETPGTRPAARALSGTGPVAAEARERALEAARALGYEPNHLAVSMRSGRSRLIGLVIPDIANPFWAEVAKGAHGAKSKVVCDALILDEDSRTDTYPYIRIDENNVDVGHEATVSKIGEEQLFYLMSRGLSEAEASALIVSGFVEPITKELPLEYAVEMNRLIQLQMEGSVG